MDEITKPGAVTLKDLLPKSDNPNLWRKEGDRWRMPEKQSLFLDWLLTPLSEREEKSIKAWAQAHGVNPATPSEWKKDRRFRREWEDRATAKNIGVDRMQNVLDTLYQAACNGDVAAAKAYIAEVDKLRPPRQVEPDSDVADLSDEELQDEIAGLLAEGL